MKVSIIIPTFNEEKVILSCLESLKKQSLKDIEIIVIDDGSSDKTVALVSNLKSEMKNLTLLTQNHNGPGAARNLAASKAQGEILVFVDADMEFDPNFIQMLTGQIEKDKVIGTFSKDEYLLNKDNALARCWNLNLGRKFDRMIPASYPNESPVYRAILKEKFNQVGGFDIKIGYTDDWSLSRKLGQKAINSSGAVFYHRNPETLAEVWTQARWFGKNEFLTGSLIRKLYNLYRYFPPLAILKGLTGAVLFKEIEFVNFKIVYDTAVFTSVFRSFFSEQKNK